MPNEQKKTVVNELTEQMQNAKAMVFADYRGLSVSQLQTLRRELAKHNATLTVTKNTLLSLAAKATNRQIDDQVLSGPTATLMAFGDEVAPIKALVTFAKEQELPTVKAGLLGDTVLSVSQIQALAALPSREVLLAQVVGTIKAPLTGMVNVLQGNIRGLVYALAAIRDQRQA
jgi:large subunit ribosomal protein L10